MRRAFSVSGDREHGAEPPCFEGQFPAFAGIGQLTVILPKSSPAKAGACLFKARGFSPVVSQHRITLDNGFVGLHTPLPVKCHSRIVCSKAAGPRWHNKGCWSSLPPKRQTRRLKRRTTARRGRKASGLDAAQAAETAGLPNGRLRHSLPSGRKDHVHRASQAIRPGAASQNILRSRNRANPPKDGDAKLRACPPAAKQGMAAGPPHCTRSMESKLCTERHSRLHALMFPACWPGWS